jgi:hypothetical protein
MHQVIDIRVGSSRYQFVDAAAEDAHNETLRLARAAIPPRVKHVVAPGHTVAGARGQVLLAGAPITVDDVAPDPGAPEQGRPAWRVFEDAVFAGVILENYDHIPPKP